MPGIIKRPRARSDVAEIWDYIADDSSARADAFVDSLDRKLRALAERPHMGRTREELADGLRSLPVGRYVIFYRVLAEGIEVVRVVHGARDLGAIFDTDEG